MAIHDVNATELIHRSAGELKKVEQMKPPAWAPFAKTGISRERPPVQDDWWHIRAAAILRKLFMHGPIGTSKLTVQFGGKKNRGHQPEKSFPASGNHIRKILQQLEKAGLAKKAEKGVHKGRVITPQGQKLLEAIAGQLMKEQNVVMPKRPDVKLEPEKPKKKKARKKRTAKKKAEKKEEPEKKGEPAVEKPAESKEEKKEAPKEAEEKKE